MEGADAGGGPAPTRRRFCWQRLQDDTHERRSLCEAMSALGYAVVAVPPAMQSRVAELQAMAGEFFDRPRPERCALGHLRLFRDKVVGYRELGGGAARFLELHRLACGRDVVVPRPRSPAGLGPAAARLYAEFQAMARTMITWLAEYIEVPAAALLQCLDEASLANLEDSDCGASVLRLCCYGDGPEAEAAGEEGGSDPRGNDLEAEAVDGNGCVNPCGGGRHEQVVFDEHTDASFLTLMPTSSKPGLQVRDSSGLGWLDIEEELCSPGGDLLVFVGDFLEVLTASAYVAVRHRVVESAREDSELARDGTLQPPARRLSMPFLVRGQPGSNIDTARFLDGADSNMPLARLEGMRYAELRQFLDMKGRRRFGGAKLLPAHGSKTDDQAG